MQNLYRRFGKRVLDIVLATIGLVLLSPVALVVALAIRLAMGPPVIFRQVRPGLHGKPFVMYKFRTMLDLRDEHGNLLPDEQRLTRLGRFLRCSTLDEIPEFWNVLKGDMSVVGPRPLLMKYLPYFTEREKQRFNIKPGMTSLAVIRGRNMLSWDERLALDVEYVQKYSFALDIKIILLTCLSVLRQKGVVEVARSIMQDLDEERKEKCRTRAKEPS